MKESPAFPKEKFFHILKHPEAFHRNESQTNSEDPLSRQTNKSRYIIFTLKSMSV